MKLETTLWFGKVEGQWPVQAFINESNALYWLQNVIEDGKKGHIWKADLVNIVEARLVTVEPKLMYGQVEDGEDWQFKCPMHHILFASIERTPEGRRVCSEGDVYRIKNGRFEGTH